MSAEVVVPSLDIMLLPMELLYTGQFTMGSWKLPNYSLTIKQVRISKMVIIISKPKLFIVAIIVLQTNTNTYFEITIIAFDICQILSLYKFTLVLEWCGIKRLCSALEQEVFYIYNML